MAATHPNTPVIDAEIEKFVSLNRCSEETAREIFATIEEKVAEILTQDSDLPEEELRAIFMKIANIWPSNFRSSRLIRQNASQLVVDLFTANKCSDLSFIHDDWMNQRSLCHIFIIYLLPFVKVNRDGKSIQKYVYTSFITRYLEAREHNPPYNSKSPGYHFMHQIVCENKASTAQKKFFCNIWNLNVGEASGLSCFCTLGAAIGLSDMLSPAAQSGDVEFLDFMLKGFAAEHKKWPATTKDIKRCTIACRQLLRGAARSTKKMMEYVLDFVMDGSREHDERRECATHEMWQMAEHNIFTERALREKFMSKIISTDLLVGAFLCVGPEQVEFLIQWGRDQEGLDDEQISRLLEDAINNISRYNSSDEDKEAARAYFSSLLTVDLNSQD